MNSEKRACLCQQRKTTLTQAINAFFGLKTDFNKKKSRNDQCHAHYQQTKFQKSDLSLKVTEKPFQDRWTEAMYPIKKYILVCLYRKITDKIQVSKSIDKNPGNYERQTNRPTNSKQMGIRVHKEDTLPIIAIH